MTSKAVTQVDGTLIKHINLHRGSARAAQARVPKAFFDTPMAAPMPSHAGRQISRRPSGHIISQRIWSTFPRRFLDTDPSVNPRAWPLILAPVAFLGHAAWRRRDSSCQRFGMPLHSLHPEPDVDLLDYDIAFRLSKTIWFPALWRRTRLHQSADRALDRREMQRVWLNVDRGDLPAPCRHARTSCTVPPSCSVCRSLVDFATKPSWVAWLFCCASGRNLRQSRRPTLKVKRRQHLSLDLYPPRNSRHHAELEGQ